MPEGADIESEKTFGELEPITFKYAVCRLLKCREADYERLVFQKVMFRRARLIGFFISWFHPDFHFQEKLLIRQVAETHSLNEVQADIDFYQHKYVVNSMRRDGLNCRLSGKRLMRLARRAFAAAEQP